MTTVTILTILACVFGFYMAWNIGANDVANAMGTSVGAGALTLKQAVVVAAIFEFAGAFLVGTHVSNTIRKGIVPPEIFTQYRVEDVKDYKSFSGALSAPKNEFLINFTSKIKPEILKALVASPENKNNQIAFISEINRICKDENLFEGISLEGVKKRNVTKKKIAENAKITDPKKKITEKINQLLVNDAYAEIADMRSGARYLVYGMLAALLAAGVWLQIASMYGWPVSTTHSIVGSVLGFGVIVGGVSSVDWAVVGKIASSWVISPLLSGTISFLIFTLVVKKVFYSQTPLKEAKKLTPWLVFAVMVVFSLVMVYKGLKNLKLNLDFGPALGISIIIGFISMIISSILIKRVDSETETEKIKHGPKVRLSLEKALRHLRTVKETAVGNIKESATSIHEEIQVLYDRVDSDEKIELNTNEYQKVEQIFKYLLILGACFLAFAHGANDVANAIGPFSAVLAILKDGVVEMKSAVPIWVLTVGGIGIVIGLATWGYKVIETIGNKITELTPSRGFCAGFGAAVTIVLASRLGLPISTTHTLVGAVLGVGLARGIGALNLSTIKNIVASWVITIPAGAGLSIVFFFILKGIFG